MKPFQNNDIPVVAGILAGLLMMVRVIYFFFMPDEILVTIVPDDAFYYLRLASQRVAEGIWTFDGSSKTTGFHLLYGYLLVAIYYIFGNIDLHTIYIIVSIFASLSIGISAFLIAKTVSNVYGVNAVPLAIAPFFSFYSIIQSSMMLESWLVILLSTITLYLVLRTNNPTLSSGIILMAVGFLGSLARTDYGILPGVLFSIFLLSYKTMPNSSLKRAAYILFGAVIGVIFVTVHTYTLSGHLFQASAETKLFWSSQLGHNILEPVKLLVDILFPVGPFKKVVVLFASVGLIVSGIYFYYVHGRRIDRSKYLQKILPLFGCILTIIAYMVIYRYDSQSIQFWYASNLLAPIAFVVAGIGFILFTKRLLIVSLIILLYYLSVGSIRIFERLWPHQVGFMTAGLYIKEKPGHEIYGAWNAGVIGYFAEDSVVNIDGLVNDEVLPYIKSNSLFDYLKLRKIHYIVDYEAMLSDDMAKRGGYQDIRMQKCLQPLQTIARDTPDWMGTSLKIFKIRSNCD